MSAACVDDLAIIRSMWTNDIDHGAQLQFHTGRNKLDGFFPTIGSWVHYGLGTLNENLPQFVVMGNPVADCCGGQEAHRANYLGPEHDGVRLVPDPANPLVYGKPAEGVFREEQRAEFELLERLNRLALAEYPEDAKAQARIKSYELAFRMQRAIPEVFEFQQETASTQKLYGLDNEKAPPFAKHCLAARRLVERGVRFIQIYHGGTGDAGGWDAHGNLRGNHAANCAQVDKPIAGLLHDLKQRGMLDETLVVWATEFGRSPGTEGLDGRDHHPFGFSVWMAGGGIKRGVVHGATDELGFSGGRKPPLRDRYPRHGAASTWARLAAPGNSRPQAARNGTRSRDSRHSGVAGARRIIGIFGLRGRFLVASGERVEIWAEILRHVRGVSLTRFAENVRFLELISRFALWGGRDGRSALGPRRRGVAAKFLWNRIDDIRTGRDRHVFAGKPALRVHRAGRWFLGGRLVLRRENGEAGKETGTEAK